MKLPIQIIALGYCCMFLARLDAQSVPVPNQMSADMDELAAKIDALLPAGWKIATSPFDQESELFDGYYGPEYGAEIVVYKNKPATIVPKNAVSIILREEVFFLMYRLTPKLSKEDWDRLTAQNALNEKKRQKFKTTLGSCRNRRMKSSHYDPSNYLPVTEEQRSLLKQYYFVWEQTKIERLPHAWFGSVSVWITDNTKYSIRPRDLEVEYTQVAKSIESVLNHYSALPKKGTESGRNGD